VSDVFWYHDASQLDDTDDGRCTVKQDDDKGLSTLRLNNINSDDDGMYIVVAVNDCATCRHVFNVTVSGMLHSVRFFDIHVHSAAEKLPSILLDTK